jgi:hypothetical protein
MLKLALPPLLLLSFAGVLHAQECDQRILPRPDTLSVEAAARAATRLADVHVQQACIVGTTTAVTLISPSSGQQLKCIRQQSSWYKRGGWTCDAPRQRAVG